MATYTTPSDGLSLTEYVNKPCQVHVLVKQIEEAPVDKDGKLLDAIRVNGKVLGGTDDSQVGREFSIQIWNPRLSDNDGGAFRTKVHLRLAAALRLIPPPQPGQPININWEAARGRQCVIYLKLETGKEGKEFLAINRAHIYDVNDPEVAHVPKDQAALMQFGVAPAAQSSQPAQQYHQQASMAGGGQASPSPSPTQWDNI